MEPAWRQQGRGRGRGQPRGAGASAVGVGGGADVGKGARDRPPQRDGNKGDMGAWAGRGRGGVSTAPAAPAGPAAPASKTQHSAPQNRGKAKGFFRLLLQLQVMYCQRRGSGRLRTIQPGRDIR